MGGSVKYYLCCFVSGLKRYQVQFEILLKTEIIESQHDPVDQQGQPNVPRDSGIPFNQVARALILARYKKVFD